MSGHEVQSYDEIGNDDVYIAVEKNFEQRNPKSDDLKDNPQKNSKKGKTSNDKNDSENCPQLNCPGRLFSQTCPHKIYNIPGCALGPNCCGKKSPLQEEKKSKPLRNVVCFKRRKPKMHIFVRNLYSYQSNFVPYGCTLQARDLSSMPNLFYAISRILNPPGGFIFGLYNENRQLVTEPDQIESGRYYMALPHIVSNLGYQFLHGLPTQKANDWVKNTNDYCDDSCGNKPSKTETHSLTSVNDDYQSSNPLLVECNIGNGEPPIVPKQEIITRSIPPAVHSKRNPDDVSGSYPINSNEIHNTVRNSNLSVQAPKAVQDKENLLSAKDSNCSSSGVSCAKFNCTNNSSNNSSMIFSRHVSMSSFQSICNGKFSCPASVKSSLHTVLGFDLPEDELPPAGNLYIPAEDELIDKASKENILCEINVQVNKNGLQPPVICQLKAHDLLSMENVCKLVASKLGTPENKRVTLLDENGMVVKNTNDIRDYRIYELQLDDEEGDSGGFNCDTSENGSDNVACDRKRKRSELKKDHKTPTEKPRKENKAKTRMITFLVCQNYNGPCKEFRVNTACVDNMVDILKNITIHLDTVSDPIVRLCSRNGDPIEHPGDLQQGCLYTAIPRSLEEAHNRQECESDMISIYTSSLYESNSIEEDQCSSRDSKSLLTLNPSKLTVASNRLSESSKKIEAEIGQAIDNAITNAMSEVRSYIAKNKTLESKLKHKFHKPKGSETNLVVLHHTTSSLTISTTSEEATEETTKRDKANRNKVAQIYKADKSEKSISDSLTKLVGHLLNGDGPNSDAVSLSDAGKEEKLAVLKMCIRGLQMVFDTMEEEVNKTTDHNETPTALPKNCS